MTKKFITVAVLALTLVGCTSKDQLKKTLENNPEILFGVIEKHPEKFFETLQRASKDAQIKMRERQEMDEKAALEEEFKNPKKPEIDESRVFHGNKQAKITIVEYSDFQCPYCSRGYKTMKEILKAYDGKVRILYKHLPLDFHPLAEPAARMYEAIAMQSHEKAIKFHDALFEQQEKMKNGGQAFLESVAKSVGANMAKLKADMNSARVEEIIAADMNEARRFEITGTPGFIVGGVTVKGAYPAEHFKMIIDRLLQQ